MMRSLFSSYEAHRLNLGWNWILLRCWTCAPLRCSAKPSPSTSAYSRPCCSSGASFFPTRMWRKVEFNYWSILGNALCWVSLCISFMWGNCGSVSTDVSRPPCCGNILFQWNYIHEPCHRHYSGISWRSEGKGKWKRQEPEKEDGLVAVMWDAVQVMGTSNQAFVSDENDDFGRRQVAHGLRR